MPSLPLEVVRIRVKRAAEIGLDYRTYATVRASTGTDIVAFLFSSNALQLFRDDQHLRGAPAAKLEQIANCKRLGAARAPLAPKALLRQLGPAGTRLIDLAASAPLFTDSPAEARDKLAHFLTRAGVAPKSVLMVGETAEERAWSANGRMAGYLTGARYFTPS